MALDDHDEDDLLAAMERLVAERPAGVRHSAPSSTPAPTHLRRYNRSLRRVPAPEP
jgi:hypothetical protein